MMAQVFDSTPKKLAILLFVLFEIGWIVFTAGFGLLLSNEEPDSTLKEDDNRKSPLYFPYYITLVGGQFVAVLGLLHAALPSGRLSSIICSLSTILNTIYFVSVGYVINATSIGIQELRWDIHYHNMYSDHHDPQLVRAIKLMLAGSIILAVSWGVVQLLSQFYKRRPQPVPARNLWCVIAEFWKNRTILVRDVSESVRLSTIPAMLLSAIGWCIFVGGYHGYYWGYFFGGWCAIFVTPLLYLASLLHAGKPSSLMAIFASILNTFFVVGMGFSVTFAGKYLYKSPHLFDTTSSQQDRDDIKENVYYNRLILGGGMVCLIFWTVVLVLWPFYRPTETGYGHTTNDEIDNSEYDNDDLLPASSSVIIHHEEHNAESQENMQQPHMEEYHTSQIEVVNA